MVGVYNVMELLGSNVIGLGSCIMQEFLWQDGCVLMVWLNGVDYVWFGGVGVSGFYINGNGYNYVMYLGQYFVDNNQ